MNTIRRETDSSSSSTHRRKYDVFLSFRGADTRYEFTSVLFDHLKRCGIFVFRDNEGLHQGEEINTALEVAIKESSNAAIIVSPDFTRSKACLFELTVIMECWRMGRLGVFPVFYHIDPSNVGKLTKDFKDHFNTLEDHPEDKEAKWEYWKSLLDKIADWPVDPKLDEDLVESSGSALKKLSDICARVVQEKSDIIPHIEHICREILAKTISDLPNISKSLVGIESLVSKIMQLLDLEKKNEVRIIGICGMGGIGKSTLAEVVRRKLSSQFEDQYFSSPIGKKRNKEDLVSIKKDLISYILPEAADLWNDGCKIKDAYQTKLHERKVLIVFDDLWDNTQVMELVEDPKWFGPESRIIITSRVHDLLHLCKDNTYEVEDLNKDATLKLFYLKAFKQPQPKEGFEKLSEEVVGCAKGLPLALEIFGSYLSNKDKERWGGYLKDLNNILDKNIFHTLKKSVKELDDGKKELFLDIACFFNGCLKDDVLHILDGAKGFGDNLKHNLSVLEEKSLLRIFEGGKLLMHDFIVDMGRQEAKSSRLLKKEDIVHVLKTSAATQENPEVKGIVLDVSLLKGETFHLKALSAMVNLRVLRIINAFGNEEVTWKGDLSRLKLRGELCAMKWKNYPFCALPEGLNFGSTKLVELKLSFSHIVQLWVGQKSFPKLRYMNLSFLPKLIETPDLREVPKLEILNLEHCTSLLMVHSSVGHLKCLKKLNISYCYKLKELPPEISSRSLEVFKLYNCRNLKIFPNIPYSLPLKHLDVSGTCFTISHP